MCSNKDIERIDSGKYVVVLKWEHYIKLWAPIAGFLGLVVAATVWKTMLEQKAFDDVKQKQEVLYFVSRGKALTDIERASVLSHVKSLEGHMSTLEAAKFFVPRTEFIATLTTQNIILQKILDNQLAKKED